MAKDLATLDVLSGGRVLFGAGLGTDSDWEAYGREFDAPEIAEQLDESLDVLQGLWSEDEFSYGGDHHTVSEATMRPNPVQEPRIPTLLDGWWPNKKPIARGARWDGIMPVPPEYPKQFTEEQLRDMMAFFTGLRDEPGEAFLGVGYDEEHPEFPEWCAEVGVTWRLTTGNDGAVEGARIDEELVRAGPPSV